MSKYQALGKKSWEEARPKFPTVPDDSYILRVLEVKPEEEKQKYQSKSGEMERQVSIIFEIVSKKDGTLAKDYENQDATGKKIFFTARPDSMGFKENGTVPAITRQLVYYILGKDAFSDETIEFDFKDFEGQKISAFIIEKPNQKGDMTNRIDRFIKPIKRPQFSQPSQTLKSKIDDIPVIEEDSMPPQGIKFQPDDNGQGISVSDIPF